MNGSMNLMRMYMHVGGISLGLTCACGLTMKQRRGSAFVLSKVYPIIVYEEYTDHEYTF